MAESRRIIRVFIASPGDLVEERRRAKAVVDEINALFADVFDCQIELVGWEDTVSVYGRPQAVINRELEKCELFVGLMWRKWGTPPDNSGRYSSGFEEEFQTSLERRRSAGRPEMSMLFKDLTEEFLRDPGEQLRKVLAFRDELIERKEILFQTFSAMEDFDRRFRACLIEHLKRVAGEAEAEALTEAQAPSAEDAGEQSGQDPRELETPFTPEGAAFLRSCLREQPGGSVPADETSVARFRLIGSLIGQQGNDFYILGSHDANVLYSARDSLSLGNGEVRALFQAGLHNFSNENAPIWSWWARLEPASYFQLVYASLSRDEIAIGAFQAMRAADFSIRDTGSLARDAVILAWFREDASRDLKNAALSYLADCGIPSDLPAVRGEYEKNDSFTSAAAANALISINLRQSRQSAFQAVLDLRPTTISDDVLDTLFENGAAGIADANVLQALGHPAAAVRRKALDIAADRGLVDVRTAESLLEDSDPVVRKDALLVLGRHSGTHSFDEARKIISKPSPGLIGLHRPLDQVADRAFDDYQRERYMALPLVELREIANSEGPYKRDAYLALIARRFASLGDELRERVDDGFSAAFDNDVSRLVEIFGPASKAVEDARPLKGFVRQNHTAAAVKLLCERRAAGDLGRIRRALRDGQRISVHAVSAYFSKWGEWDDIPLLCAAVATDTQYRGLLGGPTLGAQKAAAKAIYQIGKARLNELPTIAGIGELLPFILGIAASEQIAALEDDDLITLLQHPSLAVRKTASLKVIAALSRTRVGNLLNTYLGESNRFYNVIFWLDAAVALDRTQATKIAKRALRAFV